MELYQRALELQQETVLHRRWLHSHPEVGLELPETTEYVFRELERLGLAPKRCGHGITAEVGSGGRRLLLRADLDALAMEERSGLPFAASGPAAHACGHDCHGAMLLTAAKLLKEREKALCGTVLLVFQTGEEVLQGAADMIAHGLLEPKPDAAMALHVAAGRTPPGQFWCSDGSSPMMHGAARFTVCIRGTGGHSAYAHRAADPIAIAVQLCQLLQTLVPRETDPRKACTVAVGQLQAGTAANVLPEQAVLRGTVRADDAAVLQHLTGRLEELARRTAAMLGGSAQVQWEGAVPPLVCHRQTSGEMAAFLRELSIPGLQVSFGAEAAASEDFAVIAGKVPSAFVFLSAGFDDPRGDAIAHDPRVMFNEQALAMGAAAYAHCALRWLQRHGQTGEITDK